MRISRTKFIYLISPLKINSSFYNDLVRILKKGKVEYFQLRLKKENLNKKYIIGKKIQKICDKFKVKFLINDDPVMAKQVNADGCHLGQKDMSINNAKRILKKK